MEQPHEPPQSTSTFGSRENNNLAAGPSQSHLPVYVLIFLLVVAVVIGFLWYDLRTAYRDTLNYWDSNLTNSADLQINVGNLWLAERRTDTEAIARSTATIRLLSFRESSANMADTRQEVERAVDKMARINGFVGGAVGDMECKIVAQSGVLPEAEEGIQAACREAQASGGITFVAAHRRPPHVWFVMAFPVSAAEGTSPAAQHSRHWCGAAVMVAEPWYTLSRPLEEAGRSNWSAETEIIWREQGEAVSFSPRLSNEGVESVFRLPLGGNAFEPRAAREGKVGFGDLIDYRGRKVFAVARPIPMAGASLACKVDRDRALSDFHRRVLFEWLAGALFVLLFGSVIATQHRHLIVRDLQEKLRQQEAVKESERRYRVLFESAGDAIFLLRGDTVIDCNQKALELYRCSRDDFIGKPITARYTRSVPDGPDPRQVALEKLREARDGQTLHFEWHAARPDGTTFDAEITLSRLGIEGDVLLLALVRDVTDRKRAEKALRNSEERLRSYFEQPLIGMAITSAEKGWIAANNRICEILGYSLEELKQSDWAKLTYPDDLAADVNQFNRVLAGDIEGYSLDKRFIRKDGETIWASIAIRCLRKPDGAVDYICAIMQDITERKRAEEARRESEERFRTTFESAGIGMALVDTQGHPVKCNPVLQRMLGYSEQELARMLFTEFTHPDDRDLDMGLYRELMAGKRDRYQIEKRYITKDARILWGLLTVSVVKDLLGQPQYCVGMAEDITERKRAHEELQRSLDELHALAGRLQSVREEERKRLSREIHDQLGQALTAIKLDLSSLVRGLPAAHGPFLEKGTPLLRLVDETIESVRRISTELRPGMLDDLGLAATVEWAAEEFATRTGTKCLLDLATEQIAVDSETAIVVFRIFQETLTNVARHAHASEVKVRLAEENGDLTLEVQDNGRGIGEDELANANSLGILGMRERALLLRGTLTITGQPGKGTTVRIRIPESRNA